MNFWNVASFVFGVFTCIIWLGRPVDSRDPDEDDGSDFDDEADTLEYER